MQRRDFLLAAGAGSTAALAASSFAAEAAGDARELYEWRTHRLKSADQQPLVLKYLETAALPGWKRLGLGPVGVFTEIGDAATPAVHVLLVYPTFDKLASAREQLEADAEYQKAAAEYLGTKPDAPAFDRIDSWLTKAFPCAPQITPPAAKPRVLELRTYESYNEERARRKVEMFCAGEIPIFRDCGFETVFFGETLVGSGLPCLKYMLAAPDMAANEAGWKTFVEHPDWLAMRDQPQYKDTVSNIQKLFLAPTDFSQL